MITDQHVCDTQKWWIFNMCVSAQKRNKDIFTFPFASFTLPSSGKSLFFLGKKIVYQGQSLSRVYQVYQCWVGLIWLWYPPKLFCHSPPQLDRGEKTQQKTRAGRDHAAITVTKKPDSGWGQQFNYQPNQSRVMRYKTKAQNTFPPPFSSSQDLLHFPPLAPPSPEIQNNSLRYISFPKVCLKNSKSYFFLTWNQDNCHCRL